MLLHYIKLISEYEDSRRSEDVGEPSSDTDTPQRDTPDMPLHRNWSSQSSPPAATCPLATPSSSKTSRR